MFRTGVPGGHTVDLWRRRDGGPEVTAFGSPVPGKCKDARTARPDEEASVLPHLGKEVSREGVGKRQLE